MDEKQNIIQDIQRVANEVAPKRVTLRDFKTIGSIGFNKVRYYFSTWNNALTAAGIEPNPSSIKVSGYSRTPDDELLEEIGRLWEMTGRRPTESLMNAKGQHSIQPYRARWGKWSSAINEYVKRFGEPSNLEIERAEPPKILPQREKPVVIPQTHKPKAAAKKQKQIIYGEPLEFRGLRYAPINEQGVVYLFGMVSLELGFLIESIRTEFPDCEGKRQLDPKGLKWQHVKIEFEYKSSNFREHGHNPEGCDLIVCWLHDWEDCPVEVLELKSSIKLLPNS